VAIATTRVAIAVPAAHRVRALPAPSSAVVAAVERTSGVGRFIAIGQNWK
jgi:hypothetical protein